MLQTEQLKDVNDRSSALRGFLDYDRKKHDLELLEEKRWIPISGAIPKNAEKILNDVKQIKSWTMLMKNCRGRWMT